MDSRDDEILQLTRAILDGEPIDWSRESAERPELEAAIERLRLTEALVRAHRVGGATIEPAVETAALGEDGAGSAGASPRLPFTWGGLEVVEYLGSGGFGDVYRARDAVLERDVALKLRGTERTWDDATFVREAKRLARVHHPNVLTVHGAGEHDGRAGLWTDLVKGQTLEDRLSAGGSLAANEGALIGIELCRALAALHAEGIVHGDVTAANVMREAGGRIVLMDLGVSTEIGDEPPRELRGNAVAISPEQLRGEAASPGADIHALGALLYRLTTGSNPYEGDTVTDILDHRWKGDRTPLRDARPDLPAAFVEVVERALDPDPNRRFTSAGAMESALATVLGSDPGPRASGAPSTGSWRRPLLLTLVAAAGLALVGLLLKGALAPKGALDVEAELFRARSGVEERLSAGSSITPGDDLFLEIETTRPAHVYVLDEDEAGTSFLMFPVPGFDTTNPLASGVRHRLPGTRAGSPMNWKVTTAGGREHVLVVASLEPLAAVEQLLRRLPAVEPGRAIEYPQLDADTLDGLRGIGGLKESRTEGSTHRAGHLARLARRLEDEHPRRAWTWLVELNGGGT